MFSETTFLLVFGLGAICMLLGFFLVLRGVGASDSESTIKLIGIEIRASRVGPGVLFALFGVVLVVTAINKQPSSTTQVAEKAADPPAPAPQPAPAATPPAPAADTPAAAANDVAQDAADVAPVSNDGPPAVNPIVAQRTREALLIRQFLAGAANGQCDERILGPAPLLDCRSNIGLIQPQLAAAGPVQNVAYLTSGPTPVGVADRFVVQFYGGAVTWTGVMGQDGRFVTLVSP